MKSIKSLGLITLMCSQSVLASSEWVPDQVYTAGDIVTWQGETYISSHQTNDIEPVVNDIIWDGWVYVENSDIQSWEPNKEYDGGDLVKLNADYYIAKWWSEDSIPSDSSAWRKLSDFDVNPPTTPIATVLGNDEDNNGIRDDYEEAVATMYLPRQQRYTQVAIAASFVWKLQTEVALDDTITMAPESAAIALSEELALDECFKQLKTEDQDFEYPHLAYHNTAERAHRARVGLERIGKMIGKRTDLIIIPTEPCAGYNKGGTDEI